MVSKQKDACSYVSLLCQKDWSGSVWNLKSISSTKFESDDAYPPFSYAPDALHELWV